MIGAFFLLPALLAAATDPSTSAATTKVTPPACLLTVLSHQATPCKITEICKDNQASVLASISDVCLADRVEPALKAFVSACSARGIDVTVTPTAAGGDDDSSDSTVPAPKPEVILYAVVGAWAVSAIISIYLV
ncbi:hypothetical protein ACHAQH_002764 [Verticillium albo-atrum]